MIAVLLAFMVLLQCGTIYAADAPAIVINLPPAMTADDVKQLVGELSVKGATIAPPSTPPTTGTGSLIARIVNRMRQAAPAASRFIELRSLWARAVAEDGQPSNGNFWLILSGSVAAALLVEFLIRYGLPALLSGLRVKPGMPLIRAFSRHILSVAFGVTGFLVIARSSMGFLGDGSPLLIGIGSRVVDGAANWRIAMGADTSILSAASGTA
jgi:hypothetical protein